MPFVYFNRTVASVDADAVVVDPTDGVEALAKAVADAGHVRAAARSSVRATPAPVRSASRRCARPSRRSASPSRDRDVLHGPSTSRPATAAAYELLRREDAPTLLVCGNDVVALGALNAAAELGIDVPGGVSIVGFDDLPPSGWALVQLSTVAYDLDAMSREAARLVVQRVQGGADEPVRRVAFPTTWVPRATVGAPRSPA